MAKAVLIMDRMPPVCGCCKMYKSNYYIGGECTCRVTGDRVELNAKADTCPLRELPEYKRTVGTESENDKLLMNMGWNACLDALAEK